jgi:hypothetical protein
MPIIAISFEYKILDTNNTYLQKASPDNAAVIRDKFIISAKPLIGLWACYPTGGSAFLAFTMEGMGKRGILL